MSNDLLEPRAAVDWAMIQLDILANRIETWRQTPPYEIKIEFDPERGKNAIKYKIDTPPLLINAEAGVIINSIRTSLDLLAVTLAKRNGCADLNLKKVYFPICDSRAMFERSDTRKKIKALSAKDQEIINGLKPYKGGDDALYTLHELDIMRKHRNLLTVHVDRHFDWGGSGLNVLFPDQLPPAERLADRCPVAWISPDARDFNINLDVELRLAGTEFMDLKPIVPALHDFACLTYRIIDLFEQ